MGVNDRVRSISDDLVPQFRLRWWGYDRNEVDQFVTEAAADRQRLQNSLTSLDAVGVNRQQERADEVVAMARRHADEIRAAAEHEADRFVREAERQAAFLQYERLHAHRRALDRITILRSDIESCLETAASALGRARELTAVHAEAEPPSPSTDSASPVTAAATSATERADEGPRRYRGLYWIAAVVWCVLMLSIVLFVSMPPAEVGAAASASVVRDVEQKQPSQVQVVDSHVSTVSTPQQWGLTVTFVANRDCWISITTDEGAPSERLLKRSDTIVVEARDAVTFKAGNAAALSVLINDQPLGALGVEGQVVTRRITRANYRTFLSLSDEQPMTVAQVP